jgi:hypothetical protein
MNRREAMRRLGRASQAVQCQRCRKYVSKLELAWDASAVAHIDVANAKEVCTDCSADMSESNRRFYESRAKNEMLLRQASLDHLLGSIKGSSRDYLEGCEALRREFQAMGWKI